MTARTTTLRNCWAPDCDGNLATGPVTVRLVDVCNVGRCFAETLRCTDKIVYPSDMEFTATITDGCWEIDCLPVLDDLVDDCGASACDRFAWDVVEYPTFSDGAGCCPISSRALGCAGCVNPGGITELGDVALTLGKVA